MRFLLMIPFLCFFLFSCSNKYAVYKSGYDFLQKSETPDYANLDYWAAHPWKHDPSDSIPLPLLKEEKDSLVDVFFLHPTTYTGKKYPGEEWNASVNNSYINAKTDYSTILFQASVFNQHARVFAPRYRQAHYQTFFSKDTLAAEKAFDIAYDDVKRAFEYYLQHYNNGRPVIIAAHSQGSKLAEWLLKDYFENKPLQKQLVVAYIAGWPVYKNYFTALNMCADSTQTGCICSWRTMKKNYLPSYIRPELGSALATNPLTWTTGSDYAGRNQNKGSILTHFNKLYRHTTDARVVNGVLWVRKPRFPWSFLIHSKNYHVGDINLYYMNIRENVTQRVQHFFSLNKGNDQ